MTIGKHLGTFNLFREADGSLWITCAEANGVRDELNGSAAPLGLCAMTALYTAADQMRERQRKEAERHSKAGAPDKGKPQG